MSKKTIITPQQEQEIIRDYTIHNLGIMSMKKKFRTHTEHLYAILEKYGVNKRDRSKAIITPELEEKVVKLYTIGDLSYETIAKKLNISKTTARSILIKNDVSIRKTETILTEEDEKEIINMYYEQDLGKKHITTKFKISEDKLFKILEKYNINKREASRLCIPTAKQEQEIVNLYKTTNKGVFTVAKELSVSINAVIKVLFKHDIPIKNTGNRRDFTEQEELNIVKMYEIDGLSTSEISKQLDFTPVQVLNILTKYNVEIDLCYDSKRTHDVDLSYFETINTHDKSYHLGLMFADGNNSKLLNCFTINLHEKDKELLNRFKLALKSEHPLKYKPRDKQFQLRVGSKKMSEDLANLGCVPNKSLILQFPTKEQVPREFINSFILGSFDGDGSIFSRQNGVNSHGYGINLISSVPFIQSLQSVIEEEVGLFFKYKFTNEDRNAYIYTYDYDKIVKFMSWLYKDCGEYKLSRKYERFQQMLNNRGKGFIKYDILYPNSARVMK